MFKDWLLIKPYFVLSRRSRGGLGIFFGRNSLNCSNFLLYRLVVILLVRRGMSVVKQLDVILKIHIMGRKNTVVKTTRVASLSRLKTLSFPHPKFSYEKSAIWFMVVSPTPQMALFLENQSFWRSVWSRVIRSRYTRKIAHGTQNINSTSSLYLVRLRPAVLSFAYCF